jgi:hypothetical protein
MEQTGQKINLGNAGVQGNRSHKGIGGIGQNKTTWNGSIYLH